MQLVGLGRGASGRTAKASCTAPPFMSRGQEGDPLRVP